MGNDSFLILLGMTSLAIAIALAFVVMLKIKTIDRLQTEKNKLQNTLDETDEQAKLLVRTDMELNKAQEELDKKIHSLFTLQKLSRAISTTLEENQIFTRIEPEYLEVLGFEKSVAFILDPLDNKFRMMLNIGYNEAEPEDICKYIEANKDAYLDFIKQEKTLSSISNNKNDESFKTGIVLKFKVKSFVLSPVLPKEGTTGFIFVGTENADMPVSEGDEELITVLANQLGQALENARLFEKTWKAQQNLEKKVEERTHELTKALEEVKRISQRKTEFVSSVSHELRTPLTSIKGYASILLTGKLGELPPEVHLRIEKINRHSDELVQFINDLLDISRIESGRVTMRQTSEELKKISEETGDLLSGQLKEKQIQLTYDFPSDAGVVFVDLGQIKRVFINLINNAIKFTPQGGKINVTSRRTGNEIQVDVSDTGCGIPEEAQKSIFEEFYRVDNAINQQLKGTGLGLTLVKNIIEAHKGKIWVKSSGANGSTFSFTLPI